MYYFGRKLLTYSCLKGTFSAKKELLTQAYTRKPCVNKQKPVCSQDNFNQSNNAVSSLFQEFYFSLENYFLDKNKFSFLTNTDIWFAI